MKMLKQTPLIRKVSKLKRSPMKTKPLDPKYIADRKAESERMWVLFDEHWGIKKHECESCGQKLYGENKSLYHHHCYEKGIQKYEHLKYEIQNLMLLCGDCHVSVSNGYPSNEIKIRTQEVKTKFKII